LTISKERNNSAGALLEQSRLGRLYKLRPNALVSPLGRNRNGKDPSNVALAATENCPDDHIADDGHDVGRLGLQVDNEFSQA
jgi:hypothetical protein